MRILAIDYGQRRVGLAICDASETFVSPLRQLAADPAREDELWGAIKQVVREEQVEAVVVGFPLNMDGSEGFQAKLTRGFAEGLAGVLGQSVYLQDERLSSSQADELLAESGLTRDKRKRRRDMLAACTILQEFLDSGAGGESE